MNKSTNTPIDNTVNDVIDINIDSIKKKRFRINGDDNKILELNVSDVGVITRLSELYPKLQELGDKAKDIGLEDDVPTDEDDVDAFKARLDKIGAQFKDIDAGMREYIDKLFDANVSEICAPFGNMYDIVNGQFRYDNIIDVITKLYGQNIESETQALKSRLAKRTEKYAPADHKKKTSRK